uniref:PH domain-containing protein n=1 Tax=Panagrolaimus sp. PS1159 TaxID=55785 RepID=A0AC35ET86_9BILA
MSSLSIATTDADGSIPSTSSTTSRSTTSATTTRSYTSPSRRLSPTTSIRSAQASIGIRNGSISQKSNLEEDMGTNKSGIITGLMAFSKSSKKTYYAILSDRCFELHDNQKTYKKKKSARHIFDLATCFNINRHDDAKLKNCISIMTPDDTFIFRAADEEKQRDANDRATMDWYEAMMIALVNARALHLGRPVLTAEFFEYCWDVQLVSKPKIRKPVPNPENFENICVLRPELKTRHRLGFYAHTIILCRMGIQPAMSGLPKSGIPPFRTEHYIEIQRQYVASFGFQEKYFIMRVGRAASTGMCEIWAQCESEEVAASIHTRLNEIIEREGKKRKSQSSSSSHYHHPPSSSTTSTTAAATGSTSKELPSSSRSEPSHSPKIEHLTPEPTIYLPPPSLPPRTTMSLTSTASQRPRLTDITYNIPEDETLSTHSSSTGYYRPLGAKSIDQAILRDITRHEEKSIEDQPRSLTVGSQSPSSSSWLNMLRRGNNRTATTGTPTTSSLKHTERFSPTITVSQQPQPRKSSKQSSFYPVVEWAKQRASLISGNSQPDDETEDSGGTLKVVDYEDTVPDRPSVYMNGCLPHEKLIELALEGKLRYDELGSRGSTSSYLDDEVQKKDKFKDHDSESLRKRQITNDSGKGEDSYSDRYNRFTPEEQEDSLSLTADDAYSDDLSDRHQDNNFEACSTSSMGGASSHTSGHHEKESNSSGSVIQSERNTYEMMHPSKFTSRIDEHKAFSGTEESLPLSNEGLQLGEEAATSATMPKTVVRISGNVSQIPKEDLRKRAFSLGSRSWILNPLRKLSANHARASSSKASSIADESENECNESIASHRSHPESTTISTSSKTTQPAKMLSPHGRSDSIDSSVSNPSRITRYTKNSKKANDLMEVNFSPPNSIIQQYNAIGAAAKHGSNGSVDSSSNQRSRAPSFINNRITSPSTATENKEIAEGGGAEMNQGGPTTEMQMAEVQCFIKKDDEAMLYALMKEKDTTSLYSTKTESSMPYFETIEEIEPSSPRSSSRHSRKSLEPIRKESVTRLQPPVEHLNYVVIGNHPEKNPERKISVPSPRIQTAARLSLTQSRSDNLKSASESTKAK